MSLKAFKAGQALQQGNTEEAARLYLEAADTSQRLGLDPDKTRGYLKDAVGPLLLGGDPEHAAEVAKRAIAMAESLFGPADRSTLAGRSDLAQLYSQQGKHAEALEQSSFVVANLPPTRDGKQDAYHFTARGLHAMILQSNGRHDEARTRLAEVVQQARAALAMNRGRGRC